MGTKNNPGKFDCYSRAEPDEPVFVLLGRDPVAWLLVYEWAHLREELGRTEPEVLAEARQCADQMHEWAQKLGKGGEVAQAASSEDMKLSVRLRKLEALCSRAVGLLEKAADTIEQQVRICHLAADIISERVSSPTKDGRQELDDLVKELRSV